MKSLGSSTRSNFQSLEKNQAKVFLKSIRVSPTKLNIVVSPIRGLAAEKAINYLSCSLVRIY